ncbi:hypothetical protein T484DRAFT_1817853 [Baffinella frigidus]|nr:hypothetical protein T484DRAFT_1817853 [Cryptophyta sp. CCMP2293]
MRKGTFEQKWTNDDMQATECIESPHCSPNGYDNYRAEDCEGSAAKILLIQHNVRAAFYEATVYLRDCGSPEGRHGPPEATPTPAGSVTTMPRRDECAIVAQWGDRSRSNARRGPPCRNDFAQTPLGEAPPHSALCESGVLGVTLYRTTQKGPAKGFCDSVEWWGCNERDASHFTTL